MNNLSKGVIINLTANTLLSMAVKLQRERGLTNEELELAVSKVMLDITNAKSLEYANQIVELTTNVQRLEQLQKEEEIKQEATKEE